MNVSYTCDNQAPHKTPLRKTTEFGIVVGAYAHVVGTFILRMINTTRGGEVVSRLAHNQEIAGASPAPATTAHRLHLHTLCYDAGMKNAQNITWLYRIALVCLSILGIVFLFRYSIIQQDDAYIFYTYARNLAHDATYAFNIGERVSGSTSLLYPPLLAALNTILPSIAIPQLGHLVATVSILATGIVTMDMFARRRMHIAAVTFPLLFIGSPLLVHGIGMETPLVLLLLVGALNTYVRKRYRLTALLCGLAVLARPDALLFVGVLGIEFVLRTQRLPRLAPLAIFIGIVATALLFHFAYFGTWLPQSIGAKLAQTDSGRWGSGWLFFSGFSLAWGDSPMAWAYLAAPLVSGIYLVWAGRKLLKAPFFTSLLLWSFLYLVVYGVILNPPAYGWYYTPLAIITTLLVALAAEHLLSNRPLATLAVMAVIVAAFLFPLHHDQPTKYVTYRSVASWLNYSVPQHSSIASNEVGVLGYYYQNGPVIDPLGLVTSGGTRHIKNHNFAWYIHEYHPDYLVFRDPPRPILEQMVDEKWFADMYTHITTLRGPEIAAMAIYKRQQHPCYNKRTCPQIDRSGF